MNSLSLHLSAHVVSHIRRCLIDRISKKAISVVFSLILHPKGDPLLIHVHVNSACHVTVAVRDSSESIVS